MTKCPGCGLEAVLRLGRRSYCAFCFRSGARFGATNPNYQRLCKEFDDVINDEEAKR